MKNPLIFEVSNTSIYRRGHEMLAPQKAGILRFTPYGKTALFTCRGLPIMGIPTRAERLVFDSGKGITLFLCPKLNIEHNASTYTLPRTGFAQGDKINQEAAHAPGKGTPSAGENQQAFAKAGFKTGLISPNLLTRISPCS